MQTKYKLVLHIADELPVLAKVLLIFQRKLIFVDKMDVERSLEEGCYRINILAECSFENLEKTSRLLKKQEGVSLLNFDRA